MSFNVIVAANSFNRPADTTAYTSGDLVANNTSAGSVVPLAFSVAISAGGAFLIRRARLLKSSVTVTNASFRLHLYGTSPTPAAGDNGAWSTGESSYLGWIDLDLSGSAAKVFSNGVKGFAIPNIGTEIAHKLASGLLIYGLLEARAAYAPANAETFTVQLEAVQNS